MFSLGLSLVNIRHLTIELFKIFTTNNKEDLNYFVQLLVR